MTLCKTKIQGKKEKITVMPVHTSRNILYIRDYTFSLSLIKALDGELHCTRVFITKLFKKPKEKLEKVQSGDEEVQKT